MRSFPFDSVITYDEDGNRVLDRAVNSDILAGYFHLLFTDGVFPNPSTGLQVTELPESFSVTVKPGNVCIQGRLGIETEERTLVFEAAGTYYDRIDSVVARLNSNYDYRKIDLYIIKGTEASTPKHPELTRTGGIYELRLADVFIAKNTSTISAERITDTRLVTSDCGIVTANPERVDTTAIFNQYQAELESFKDGREAEYFEWKQQIEELYKNYILGKQDAFDTWFERIQKQLSEDAAGNLQLQIDDLSLNDNNWNRYFYVNPETGSDEGSGTRSDPFKTLQKAIDMCPSIYTNAERTVNKIYCFPGNVGRAIIRGKRVQIEPTQGSPYIEVLTGKVVIEGMELYDAYVAFYESVFSSDDINPPDIQFSFVGKTFMSNVITALRSEILIKADIEYMDVAKGLGGTQVNSAIFLQQSRLRIAFHKMVLSGQTIRGVCADDLSVAYIELDTIEYDKTLAQEIDENVESPISSTIAFRCLDNSFMSIKPYSADQIEIKDTIYTGLQSTQTGVIYYSKLLNNAKKDKYVISSYGFIPQVQPEIGTTSLSGYVMDDETISGVLKYAAGLAQKHETELTDYVKVVTVTAPETDVSASTYKEIKVAYADLVPDGYKAIFATPRTSSNNALVWSYCYLSSGNVVMRVRNVTSTALTATKPTAYLICIRT